MGTTFARSPVPGAHPGVALARSDIRAHWALKGERIIGVLRDLIGNCAIEDLPVSFTAAATDLGSGRARTGARRSQTNSPPAEQTGAGCWSSCGSVEGADGPLKLMRRSRSLACRDDGLSLVLCLQCGDTFTRGARAIPDVVGISSA